MTIHKITNASSFEPVAPCRGRFAAISIRAGNLPPDAGLNHLRATIGSSLGTITSIGAPDRDGWQRIRVDLPELEATGGPAGSLFWLDRPDLPACDVARDSARPSHPAHCHCSATDRKSHRKIDARGNRTSLGDRNLGGRTTRRPRAIRRHRCRRRGNPRIEACRERACGWFRDESDARSRDWVHEPGETRRAGEDWSGSSEGRAGG